MLISVCVNGYINLLPFLNLEYVRFFDICFDIDIGGVFDFGNFQTW